MSCTDPVELVSALSELVTQAEEVKITRNIIRDTITVQYLFTLRFWGKYFQPNNYLSVSPPALSLSLTPSLSLSLSLTLFLSFFEFKTHDVRIKTNFQQIL